MKSARLFSRDGLLVTVFTLASALSWSNTSLAASLVLSWKDTSSNETGFKVERALGTTGSFSQIASVGANMQSYTDSSISGGNTYCYRVRAYNSTGSSSPSNKACVNVTSSSGSTGQGGGSTSGSSGGTTSPSSSGSVIPISTSTTIEKHDIPWTNYRFKVKLKSTDNDAIGVMFRYQDENNHYRFIWYREKNSRRLERRVNGKFYTLSEDAVPYKPGQTYELEIIATGKNLRVRIDDSDIFYDVDSSLTWGTVALYTGFNAGSYFDDVHVQDLTGVTLLREDFNDGRANGWAIVDTGDLYGHSLWAISNGILVQSGNIGSDHGRAQGTYLLYTN